MPISTNSVPSCYIVEGLIVGDNIAVCFIKSRGKRHFSVGVFFSPRKKGRLAHAPVSNALQAEIQCICQKQSKLLFTEGSSKMQIWEGEG